MRILVHICCAPCFTSVHKRLLDEGHEVVGYFYNPNIHPYQEYQRRLHCLERYTALKPVEMIYDKEYDLDKYLVGSLQAKYDPPKEVVEFRTGNARSNKELNERPDKLSGKNKGGFVEKIQMKESLHIQLTPKDPSTDSSTNLEIDESDLKNTSATSQQTKGTDPDFHSRCGYCIRLRLARTAQVAAENGFDAFTTTLLESRYQPHEYIRFVGALLADKFKVKFYYADFRAGWKESVKLSKEMELYRQPYCGCIFSEYERFGTTKK